MITFDEMLKRFEYSPRMESFAMKLVDGRIVEPYLFKSSGKTEEEAKEKLTSLIMPFVDGKQEVIRVMPTVRINEDGTYYGRARIATY